MNKADKLELLLLTYDPHVVVITETWLHDGVRDDEIIPPGYQMHRRDRGTRGGGVAVICKLGIDVCLINQIADHESLFLNVTVNGLTFMLCVVYKAPEVSDSFLEQLYDHLLLNRTRHIMITGDFNLPAIKWKNLAYGQYKSSDVVLDAMLALNLDQIVCEPTRNSAVLDLFFVSDIFLNGVITVEKGVSDHSLLFFSWPYRCSVVRSSTNSVDVKDFDRADDTAITDYLDSVLSYSTHDDVHALWMRFKSAVWFSIQQFVPFRKVRQNRKHPWISREIIHIKRRIKRLRKRKNVAPEKFEVLKRNLATKVNDARTHYYQVTLPSFIKEDPAKFWRFLAQTNETVNRIKLDGKYETDGFLISQAFNEYFHSVFTFSNAYVPLPAIVNEVNIPTVTREGVLILLRKLSTKKSIGPDQIPNTFLKRYSTQITDFLTEVFNKSLRSGEVPGDWKIARVVPIHKKGDKSIVSNYRPVSLTSVSCKLLEHIVAQNIQCFLADNNILSPCQHGFRKGLSTTTQLVITIHDFMAVLDRSGQTDILLLDFSKAFDKVPHSKLLLKLRNIGLPLYLIKWVESYLTNRKQFVEIKSSVSGMLNVTSGVPQGSVLGPLLFLIYVNDLVQAIPDTVSIKLFADDCVVFKEITCSDDHNLLQQALRNIECWCAAWDMELNVDKTVLINITRKTNPSVFTYNIHGSPIQSVTQYKYLGITLSSDMTWRAHISSICTSAFRKLCFLKRKLAKATVNVKLQAYNAIIRPKLEYASVVWDPYTKKDIQSLEALQKKAIRFIFNKYKRLDSPTQLMNANNIPTLAVRRKISRLKFLRNIFNGKLGMSAPSYLKTTTARTTRNAHKHTLQHIFAKTEAFKQSFFPRTVSDWNSLPKFVCEADDFDEVLEQYLCCIEH